MALAIELGYAALLLLVALSLLWSRWPGWLRGGVVAGVTALYFVGSHAVHAIWGVPSRDGLPERFQMVAALVDEPSGDRPGALYVWVNELQDKRPNAQPRAYRLPYTRELHEQLSDGMRRGGDGVDQMGTAEPKPGAAGGGFFGLRPGNDEQEIRIRDLPAPRLPAK
jgi:hypothetical protein